MGDAFNLTIVFHDYWVGLVKTVKRTRRGGENRFDEIPRPNRLSDPLVMSRLYRAMEEKLAIQILYTSTTTGKDDSQWVAPVRFASDGERIHLRAFSFKHHEYRDYVPVRIGTGSSFKTRPLVDDLPIDEDWETIALIPLIPRHDLSADQARAVRREYGFQVKTLCIQTRKALEFYADRRWGLDQKSSRLERHATEYVRPD